MRGKIVFFFILLLTGLSECTTSISEIGADFFTNKNTFDIASVDTMTLKVSTLMWQDSMVTSTTKRLLVGHQEDEKLGTITSQGILQVGITGKIALAKGTTDYVGLRLKLKKDGYWFYDTTKAQTISVYRLTKNLVAYTGLYSNKSKFSIDSIPLGSLTFLPRPLHTGDSVEVPLSDDLGRQLMEMAKTDDPRLATNGEFVKFFKGLALIPDTLQSRAVIGFHSAGTANAFNRPSQPTELRLYYNDRSTTPTTLKHISFTIGNSPYFSRIHSYRGDTKLSAINKKNQAVVSTLTDHEGYFQCGVGLAMRVEMPGLHTLRHNDAGFFATRAVLEIRAVRESYLFNPLPPNLVLYYVNEQNNLLSPNPFGIQLVKDVQYGRNTLYQTDVTTFVNSQLQSLINNKNALLISLDDSQYRSTVNRLYLGDQRNDYYMRLRIFYITLPNQPN